MVSVVVDPGEDSFGTNALRITVLWHIWKIFHQHEKWPVTFVFRITLTAASFFLQHCFFPPLWCHPLFFPAAMLLFFLLSSERQMRNKRERKPLGLCPHIITTPFNSPPLVLYPPSLCLPEWQLAASRVHWALPTRVPIFCQLTWEKNIFARDWSLRAAALYLPLLLFFLKGGTVAQTHAAHMTLPAAHRALWSLQHATVRSHTRPVDEGTWPRRQLL